jgi:hypothetical protein
MTHSFGFVGAKSNFFPPTPIKFWINRRTGFVSAFSGHFEKLIFALL